MVEGLRTVSSIRDIAPDVWDGLANDDRQRFNPFISHAFLSSLEDSGSATAKTGWAPLHLICELEGKIAGIVPCYLKSHSMGEYVFDHGWAEAFQRAGGNYYPKLQVSVPFTPVTTPKLLGPGDLHSQLSKGLQTLAAQVQASSVHQTFVPNDHWTNAPEQWLRRQDIQFHWHNAHYENFGRFLTSLSSSKRKNIRRERQAVADRGIVFEHLTGSDLTEAHWDSFYAFYMDTGSRKWGHPYLTRDFFSLVSERMAKDILLIMAKRDGKTIAGALNFIGGDRLYGRNWGCVEDHPFLHFETCYYQAIDFAISHRLKVVEAGAQGEHKLARGYLPVTTHSLHYFAHGGLQKAVKNYLDQERAAIAQDQVLLSEHSPFKSAEKKE